MTSLFETFDPSDEHASCNAKVDRSTDTNRLFEPPTCVEMRITEWNDNNHRDVAEEALRKRG